MGTECVELVVVREEGLIQSLVSREARVMFGQAGPAGRSRQLSFLELRQALTLTRPNVGQRNTFSEFDGAKYKARITKHGTKSRIEHSVRSR